MQTLKTPNVLSLSRIKQLYKYKYSTEYYNYYYSTEYTLYEYLKRSYEKIHASIYIFLHFRVI